MIDFTAGQIIKRKDGGVFPDDKHWAVVREPERLDHYRSVWIEGGQWVPEYEVTGVLPDEVLGVVERYGVLTHRPGLIEQFKPKVVEKAAEPLRMSEDQWRAKVLDRHQKRAAKANEHNQELIAENLKLKKEVAEAKVQARRNVFDGDAAEANHSALLLIREIVQEVRPVVRLV